MCALVSVNGQKLGHVLYERAWPCCLFIKVQFQMFELLLQREEMDSNLWLVVTVVYSK